MANTVKHYLEKIKLENELHDLFLKAANVEVTYDGAVMSLAGALTEIYGSLSNVPTTSAMNTAISSAIAASGHAHFEKAAAVPEVDAARENVLYLVPNAKTKHLDMYAKVAGETEGTFTMEWLDDTTVDLSGKLDKVAGAAAGNLPALSADGTLADSGKRAGGETLAGTPDADTLATEKAVAGAVDPLRTMLDGIGGTGLRLSTPAGSGAAVLLGSDGQALSYQDENGKDFWIGYNKDDGKYYKTYENGDYIIDRTGGQRNKIEIDPSDPNLVAALAAATYNRPATVPAYVDEAVAAAAHKHGNKDVLDGITAEKVAAWDGLRGVRYGAEPPADMRDGELFIRVVTTATEA